MSSPTDAELVAAHLSGDPGALASIYDRYAGSLYDTAAAMTRSRDDAADLTQDVFVIAAERLGQLRDHTRLKPWLFAVLRNEVYRRSGKQRRTVATDFTGPAAEMALPTDDHDPAANAERDELAALVRGAAAGLDERDQLILELSVRQGLEGDDLADALGVNPQQCYSLLHRMRLRTERSLAAFCVAHQGRADCPDLAGILQGWDGEFSVLVRKRVARHVDHCETCQTKRRALAPIALFGAAPAFAAPAGLRDRVLAGAEAASPAGAGAGGAAGYGFGAPGGFPTAIKYVQRAALWLVATVAAVMFATGTTVYVLAADETDTPVTSTTSTTSPVTEAAGGAAPTTALLSPTTVADDPSTAAVPPSTATATSTTSTTSTSTSTTTTTTPTTPAAAPVATTAAPQAPAPPAATTTTAAPTTTVAPTTTTPATTTTVAPGVLSLSAGTIDFGTTLDQARLVLSNTGGATVDWSTVTGPVGLRGAPSPFSVSPGAGSLAPGAEIEVVVGFDRSWSNEGTRSQALAFVDGETSAKVDLTGTIVRAPVIGKRAAACIGAPPPAPPGTSAFELSANVSDESYPVSGVVRLSNGAGWSATVPAVQTYQPPVSNDPADPAALEARFNLDGPEIDPDGDGVTLAWTLIVTDAVGANAEISGSLSVPALPCS